MPAIKVFDSWALLAWLLDQPAAAHVEGLLQNADQSDDLELIMSWVNIGDVAKAVGFLKRLTSLPLRLVVPQPDDFIEAARLKSTRRISYADAFAAALARKEAAVLVTGDPELRNLSDVVTIEWIGA